MKDIKLHVGLSEVQWNGYDIPSSIEYACVSPISGRTARTRKENWVNVPCGVPVIQDSGAFSDSWDTRLSVEAAWDRQMEHAEKHGYASQLSHRASYDLLIDETWQDGKRSKKRWSYEDAKDAVQATVAASRFAATKRDNVGLVQSAQGVEPEQYLDCVRQIAPFIDPDRDKLGFPFAASQGILDIHIWGVIYPPALGLLLWWSDQHGISVSTDSTSPALQMVWGNWGYAEWRREIERIPKDKMGLARMIHACQTKHYLSNLRETQHYKSHFVAAKRDNQCIVCGNPITKRAKTCSDRCRKRKSRMVTSCRSAVCDTPQQLSLFEMDNDILPVAP